MVISSLAWLAGWSSLRTEQFQFILMENGWPGVSLTLCDSGLGMDQEDSTMALTRRVLCVCVSLSVWVCVCVFVCMSVCLCWCLCVYMCYLLLSFYLYNRHLLTNCLSLS